MISAQDIREKIFEKAVFGGYDMATVDAFLEEVANDLALLQKENATLRGKMKVLVNKVEEYRGNEDALRMAVISAQRLGNMIEAEAKEKADATIAEANAEADKITTAAQLKVNVEKARLADAEAASAEFISNMRLLCSQQGEFLDKLSSMDFVQRYAETVIAQSEAALTDAQAAGEIHETVKSIEETITADENLPAVEDMAPAAGAVANNVVSFSTAPGDDLEKTVQFSFDNLGG